MSADGFWRNFFVNRQKKTVSTAHGAQGIWIAMIGTQCVRGLRFACIWIANRASDLHTSNSDCIHVRECGSARQRENRFCQDGGICRGHQLAGPSIGHGTCRAGQVPTGTLTRIWARRGTRPRAPRDTRYQWAYRPRRFRPGSVPGCMAAGSAGRDCRARRGHLSHASLHRRG